MGFGYYPYIIPSGINPDIYTSDGNLILQLGYVAGVSAIKGQVATGTDLNLYANSTDSYPYFRLHGAGEVEVSYAAGSYFKILSSATQALKTTYATNITTIAGGTCVGDDLYLKANSTSTRSLIKIEGDSNITFDLDNTKFWYLRTDGYTRLSFSYTSPDAILTSGTNTNIYLNPNGTGKVKFGTYTAGAATDSTGYITIVDNGGTTRKLMVQA